MSAFRPLDQVPVYFDTDGVTPAAAGTLYFYETGTSTPKNVYTDATLGTAQGTSVTLDSAGRPSVDFWGDGEYTVTLKNSSGTAIWTRDNVRDVVTGGLSIPALTADYFLTNDGSLLAWAAISQVPDMTGNTGKILGTDGTSALWQSISSLNIPVITAAVGSLKLGTKLIQWGSGSAAATGSRQTSASVTFGTAYDSTPDIIIPVCTSSSVASYTQYVMPGITSKSTTGFTVLWTAGEVDDSQSGYNLTSAVAFDYFVIGTKA